MKTSEKILNLKQEISLITYSPIIELIDISKIQLFEAQSKFSKQIETIEKCLLNSDYLHSENHKNIYNAYNELIVYEIIEQKTKIEFESTINNQKTPDFKISYNKYSCYAELKTFHFLDGNNNYLELQDESTNLKIQLEKEIKKSEKAINFSEPLVIAPFKNRNKPNLITLNFIIETIIDKARQNYKENQVNYKNKKGIFMIDLSQLLIQPDYNEAKPVKLGKLYNDLNSGILWNAVFCETGDPSYNWIEFEGKPNIGERFKRNGILKDSLNFRSLSAVVFIVSNSSSKKIIGFHKTDETDKDVLEILFKICDFVNDDLNSNGYAI
jgi:hypothetical protein